VYGLARALPPLEGEVLMNKRRVLCTILIGAGLIVMPILGYLLSLHLLPTPQVAVIRVTWDLWSDYTRYVSEALEAVGGDPAVRAVVIEIASPGGEVTASEGLYFDLLRLREAKPVVASIGEMAASGAYYVACAADLIYAKPASAVGNVGVISFLPGPELIDEELLTTGPFKLSGGPQLSWVGQMEMLKETFLEAILAQRGDRLQVGPEILSRGEIYLGLQAQQMGLVDEIGSQTDAIARAAQMAGLRRYDVVDYTPEWEEDFFLFDFGQARRRTAAALASPPENLPPGFYYRYVEPLP
jgi:protease IV